MSELHVVTGAFGYSGKYITTRLLEAGARVRTLTNSPHRANPFGDKVEAHPFNFDNPTALVESLRGAHHEMYELDDLVPALLEVPLLLRLAWKKVRGW